MITLEDLAGYAGLLTAMLAAMSYGWRWHTTPARKRFSLAAVVLSGLAVFAIKERRTGPHSAG